MPHQSNIIRSEESVPGSTDKKKIVLQTIFFFLCSNFLSLQLNSTCEVIGMVKSVNINYSQYFLRFGCAYIWNEKKKFTQFGFECNVTGKKDSSMHSIIAEWVHIAHAMQPKRSIPQCKSQFECSHSISNNKLKLPCAPEWLRG